MSGIKNLSKLLKSLQPELKKADFVFCTIPEAKYGDFAELAPIGSFIEKEGLTLILHREKAEQAGLKYSAVMKMITLNVHSSLEAVGLTAIVATCLANHGISANVVAAYFHDHIFVPKIQAQAAFEALVQLANSQN